MPLLSHLLEAEREAVAMELQMHVFADGELIVRQGAPGRRLFLLIDGHAVATLQANDPAAEPEEVRSHGRPGPSARGGPIERSLELRRGVRPRPRRRNPSSWQLSGGGTDAVSPQQVLRFYVSGSHAGERLVPHVAAT